MTVTLYRSTDTGAPTLTGQVGSLINLLDAILVNGYGSKPSMGWTKPYSGTNKAAYRQRTDITNGFYLRVVDDGSSGNNFARLTGYEDMTDVDTGTGPFPTSAQLSGGMWCRKSSTTDGTARAWWCITNNKVFYLFINTDGTGNYIYPIAFGDFYSFLPSDGFNTFIAGQIDNGTTGYHFGSGSNNNLYVARPYTQSGGSLACYYGHLFYNARNQSYYLGSGGTSYPDAITNSLNIVPIVLQEGTSMLLYRGRLLGLWEILHSGGTFNTNDTFSGKGEISNKSFLILRYRTYNFTNFQFALETSDTWEE